MLYPTTFYSTEELSLLQTLIQIIIGRHCSISVSKEDRTQVLHNSTSPDDILNALNGKGPFMLSVYRPKTGAFDGEFHIQAGQHHLDSPLLPDSPMDGICISIIEELVSRHKD